MTSPDIPLDDEEEEPPPPDAEAFVGRRLLVRLTPARNVVVLARHSPHRVELST